MRLRNIPGASQYLKDDKHYVINNVDLTKKDWIKNIFNNDNPIYIEIGMGKGGFLFENAKQNPNINYIGIEKYPTITYLALKKFYENNNKISNIKIMDYDAKDLEEIFKPKSVDKIFLTFSDPWPKDRHFKRRLVYRKFLKIYKNILSDKGSIEFKTDQESLFLFGLKEVMETNLFNVKSKTNDLHRDKKNIIMTEYEKKFTKLGNNIYWAKLMK